MWIEFTPQAGHEQSGRRSVLVLSNRTYNASRGLALLCPISSRIGGYDFEVNVHSDADITGVVLADQVRSMDWRARYAQHIGKATPDVVDEVVGKIASMIGV